MWGICGGYAGDLDMRGICGGSGYVGDMRGSRICGGYAGDKQGICGGSGYVGDMRGICGGAGYVGDMRGSRICGGSGLERVIHNAHTLYNVLLFTVSLHQIVEGDQISGDRLRVGLTVCIMSCVGICAYICYAAWLLD